MKNNNIRGLILEINNNNYNYFECSFDRSMAKKECIICQEEFQQGQKLAGHGNKETEVHKCAGHVFHKDCLQKWLKQTNADNQCPIDRQKINGLPTDMRSNNDAEYRNELCRQLIQLIEDYNITEDPDTKVELETQIRTLGNQRVYVGRMPIRMQHTVSNIHYYHEIDGLLPYHGFDPQIRVSRETLNTLRQVMQPPIEPQRIERLRGVPLEVPELGNLGERIVRRRNAEDLLPAQAAIDQAQGGGSCIEVVFLSIFGCFLGR